MFVSFLEPYPIRNKKAPFLWVFYKQLMHFKKDDVFFIGSSDYFKNPEYYKERDEFKDYPQFKNEYKIPSFDKIKEYNKYEIDLKIFQELENKFKNRLEIYKFLLTNEYEPLVKEIKKVLSSFENIEGIITWANSPSLNKAAMEFGIKVIHNELGPFRKPLYIQTAYFDFSGVNGNTESEKRFKNFLKENINLFEIDELRNLFLNENIIYEFEKKYKLGIALQVEDDSNILAYSNGYNTLKLINEARFYYEKDEILIRQHPLGLFNVIDKLGVIDDSANSIEFIKKSQQIMTINSSIGAEALLFETPVCAKGDSSYSFIVSKDIPAKLPSNLKEFLNFYMINYLIPYTVLFDLEYYRFRLNEFSEKVIFDKHVDFLFSIKNLNRYRMLTSKYEKLLNEYSKKDKKLEKQRKVIKEKNELIKKQKKAIEEKNELIKKQRETIEEKNELIKKQRKAIEEKNELINKYKTEVLHLKQILANKEKEITKLNHLNTKYKNEIYMYYMSNSWKITRILRKIAKKLKGKI